MELPPCCPLLPPHLAEEAIGAGYEGPRPRPPPPPAGAPAPHAAMQVYRLPATPLGQPGGAGCGGGSDRQTPAGPRPGSSLLDLAPWVTKPGGARAAAPLPPLCLPRSIWKPGFARVRFRQGSHRGVQLLTCVRRALGLPPMPPSRAGRAWSVCRLRLLGPYRGPQRGSRGRACCSPRRLVAVAAEQPGHFRRPGK